MMELRASARIKYNDETLVFKVFNTVFLNVCVWHFSNAREFAKPTTIQFLQKTKTNISPTTNTTTTTSPL